LSVVPNNLLHSADSLNLPSFGITLDIVNAVNRLDIYTRYLSYWKSCVIRNTQLIDSVTYRTGPNEPLKTVKPNSELPVTGWGSYFEVNSAAATPEGSVEFVCVNDKFALIQQKQRGKRVA